MLPDPVKIINKKIVFVKRLVTESVTDPEFRNLVEAKFSGIPQSSYLGVLWIWQNSFRFIQESNGVDYAKHAIEFVRDGYGDCEDFTVFNATVMRLLGIPYRVRVTDTKGQGYFTHIMIEIRDRSGKWVPFDGTFRRRGIGGEPPVLGAYRHYYV